MVGGEKVGHRPSPYILPLTLRQFSRFGTKRKGIKLEKEVVEAVVREIMQLEEAIQKQDEIDMKALVRKDQLKQNRDNRYKGTYVTAESQGHQLKGYWVPIEIWNDKNIAWCEKQVLIELMNRAIDYKLVISLSWLSEICDYSLTNIKRILYNLRDKKYLFVFPIRKWGTLDGCKRYIKINQFKYTLPSKYN